MALEHSNRSISVAPVRQISRWGHFKAAQLKKQHVFFKTSLCHKVLCLSLKLQLNVPVSFHKGRVIVVFGLALFSAVRLT